MKRLPRVFAALLAWTAASGSLPAAEPKPALETWAEPRTGMRFVRIPKHCVQMGSGQPILARGQRWREYGYQADLAEREHPRHEVCLDAFWIGETEVSAGEWAVAMAAAPAGDPARPAANVTWLQAKEFANRLSALSGGGRAFRLPTEAEWEAACRYGGKETTPLRFADVWAEAWERSPYSLTPLGPVRDSGHRTATGLHGMLGNVWEWVEDDYAANAYRSRPLFNPVHRSPGAMKGMRGGSYRSEAFWWRCAARSAYMAPEALPTIGFRLVFSE
jgi:formylglycine-generating enzyme required for sulfatase activity